MQETIILGSPFCFLGGLDFTEVEGVEVEAGAGFSVSGLDTLSFSSCSEGLGNGASNPSSNAAKVASMWWSTARSLCRLHRSEQYFTSVTAAFADCDLREPWRRG